MTYELNPKLWKADILAADSVIGDIPQTIEIKGL